MTEPEKVNLGDGPMPDGLTHVWVSGFLSIESGNVVREKIDGVVRDHTDMNRAKILCGGKLRSPFDCYANRENAFANAARLLKSSRVRVSIEEGRLQKSCLEHGVSFNSLMANLEPKQAEQPAAKAA